MQLAWVTIVPEAHIWGARDTKHFIRKYTDEAHIWGARDTKHCIRKYTDTRQRR